MFSAFIRNGCGDGGLIVNIDLKYPPDPHGCHQCMQLLKMMDLPTTTAAVRTYDVIARWVAKAPAILYPKVLYNTHSPVSMVWWNYINPVLASTCVRSGFRTILGMIAKYKN